MATDVDGNGLDLDRSGGKTRLLLVGGFLSVGFSLFFLRWRLETEDAIVSETLARLAVRLLLPLAGIMAVAFAVVRSPKSVTVLGSAALCASLAGLGIAEEWDTFRLMATAAATVAAVGAVVMLMPGALRRFAVSVLVLMHFGGIFAATTSVPFPGSNPPWLTMQLWTRFYRPYLNFVYLNNAYHFYSPEPGPTTLLWVRIEYADGKSRWETIPNRPEHVKDPLLIEYYRRLSLVEAVNQAVTLPTVPIDVARRHTLASLQDGMPSPEEVAQYLPAAGQYRPPTANAKRLLEGYAEFIARSYARGDSEIQGIKVYRVVHAILHPGLFARGVEPNDPTLFMPYFQGEFDNKGALKNAEDPYLYWLIPILGPENSAVTSTLNRQGLPRRTISDPQVKVRDYLRIHAGNSPWEENL
jgi:hypothetical protein